MEFPVLVEQEGGLGAHRRQFLGGKLLMKVTFYIDQEKV